MHVTDGNQADVVDLLANYAECPHDGLPPGKDIGGFGQEGEGRFKRCCHRFDGRGGQTKAIRLSGPGREVANLDHILRSYMQPLILGLPISGLPSFPGLRHVFLRLSKLLSILAKPSGRVPPIEAPVNNPVMC